MEIQLDETQLDFLKIKQMIGRCTPGQLGSLMRQYYKKHLSKLPVASKSYIDEAVNLFNQTPDLDSPN
jgi:hypothetical protein